MKKLIKTMAVGLLLGTMGRDLCAMKFSLFEAIENGQADVVKYLLSQGANPDKVDRTEHNGMTLLHFAARYGRANIVEILLRAGANIPEDLRDNAKIREIQSKILKERATPFCAGLHGRLGAESPVRLLNGFPQITQFICNPDGKELP